MRASYCLALLAMLSVSDAVMADESFAWPKLERAVRAYRDAPSATTAAAIKAALPTQRPSYDHSPAEQSAQSAVDEFLPALLASIRKRDRLAAGLGFDLLVVIDGGNLEDTFAALSELITLDPRLFLQQLKAHDPVSPTLMTFMGERFVDREPAARCSELRARHRSLSGVQDAKLEQARRRCRDILAKAIRQCEASDRPALRGNARSITRRWQPRPAGRSGTRGWRQSRCASRPRRRRS